MLKVIIAEDDSMIASMSEEVLLRHGYEVCGIARTVLEALALCRMHQPDLAVVDWKLADGGFGTEIAPQLHNPASIGILYASGNTPHLMETATHGHACLSKPYRSTDLLRGLEIVHQMVATGTAMPPFPRGFQVLGPASAAPRVRQA